MYRICKHTSLTDAPREQNRLLVLSTLYYLTTHSLPFTSCTTLANKGRGYSEVHLKELRDTALPALEVSILTLLWNSFLWERSPTLNGRLCVLGFWFGLCIVNTLSNLQQVVTALSPPTEDHCVPS